jgi:CheY-like chemotaxis protein/nitrogen-specific signal transduction histidine kinase
MTISSVLQPLTYSSCCRSAEQKIARDTVVPLTEERLAILGHEIRNPLSALSYALQCWPAASDDSQRANELLQIMRRQVVQLTQLSNDLLDTGRIARGKFSIQHESVDIGQVVRHACEEIEPLVERCGHRLTVELETESIRLVGDKSKLVQVLANLLRNSAKFTHRHGHLSVSVEREDDMAVLSVRDNGRGIAPDKLAEIFSPPTFDNKSSPAAGDGLGIGLRLVKTIVELHGGTIEAFSQGLSHGSTFVVRLPIAVDQADDPRVAQSTPFTPDREGCRHLPQYRIVVVDDDRSMRFLMSSMLRKIKQTVMVADCGETAIELVLRERPQIVVLDLQMHGLSGFDIARELRSHIELEDLVLIAHTGNAEDASRRRATESGFDYYLVKPMSLAVLSETLLSIAESAIL